MIQNDNCASCTHYYPDEDAEGYCRFNPPVVLQTHTGGMEALGKFPRVLDNWRCGSFEIFEVVTDAPARKTPAPPK